MNTLPLLLVEEYNADEKTNPEDVVIIAIAVYGGGIEVPLPVATQRIFDGDTRFKFPGEITAGATKTRIVYRYTVPQWRELLEVTTLPESPAGLKQVMVPLLLYLQRILPNYFASIKYDQSFEPALYARLSVIN